MDKKEIRKWLMNAIKYCDNIIKSDTDEKTKEKYKDLKNDALAYRVDIKDGILSADGWAEVLDFLKRNFNFLKN
mgnify:FL=1